MIHRLPLVLFALLVATSSALAGLPNIVVILTDDQGWGDLSIHGNRNLATPHLDALATDGAAFDSFYVCQVCAPTRAEFLSGMYHPKTGVSGVSRGEGRMEPSVETIAEIFQQAGYHTGAFGKWHNGTQPPYHPNFQGFDEFYGFTSGHWGHYFSPPLDHNGQKVRGTGYVVDDFTDHAIEFIKRHQQGPFFCYLPINTPHSPMMVADRFYEKFADAPIDPRYREPEREDLAMTRAALAMVENIDWNVGRVDATLRECGIERETIVVFFSDNGPNSYRFNGGMKGRKGSLDEGGLRSPLFIRWPGKIRAGLRIDRIAGAIDLLPTLTDLAKLSFEPSRQIDGRSLKPLLLDENTAWSNRVLKSIKGKQVSVRNQRFRLDSSGRLFDIEADRGQHHDVSDRFPEITRQLKAEAESYREAMQQQFYRHRDRPFTVGYATETTLTARDAIPHGTIERSSKAPNNSFFINWTSDEDAITWDAKVVNEGLYEAIVYYTCKESNVGLTVRLSSTEADTFTQTPVTEAFDPPLYEKSKERVEKSHYFVKDFKPLSLGQLQLAIGRTQLRLTASNLQGDEAIDVHSIELRRVRSE